MASLAQTERAALADLFDVLGPDAPTLCEGWTTRDLAAHLAIRERRPDSAIGVTVSPLSGWTERVQRGYAERPWVELVEMIRTGPPAFSVFALPGADRLANTFEMFIHHEDVRRAQPDWEPRELPPEVQDRLWAGLRPITRLWMRDTPWTVVLCRPSGETLSVGRGADVVTVTGEPAELALFCAGRQAHAVVTYGGDSRVVEAVRGASFGT